MAHIFSDRPAFTGLDDSLFGFGKGADLPEDVRTVLRDVARNSREFKADDTVWSSIAGMQAAAKADLASDDLARVNGLVRRLYASSLTHGFAQGEHSAVALLESAGSRAHVGVITLDRLYRLAEAVGARRVLSPEHNQTHIALQQLDDVLAGVERVIGHDLSPPVQNGGMFGVVLRGSVYSDRHFDGIYAAWRALGLARQRGHENPSILEIGGGAGHSAFYARRFGCQRYGIIDLPHVSMAQYILLASDFGAATVRLGRSAPISLYSACELEAVDFEQWDIIINIDSIPEMSSRFANAYLSKITKKNVLMSINQESAMDNVSEKQNVVSDLAERHGLARLSRHPSWMRTGYVEEVYVVH